MKKHLYAAALLFMMAMALSPAPAQAFNSAAHLYIAEQIFPNYRWNADLYYCSAAPDLALYAQPAKWPTAFEDTHYDYIDLRPLARSYTQRICAKGWLTHNEEWGADYYAHIYPGPGYVGYVMVKANYLAGNSGLPLDFAHFAIETAIDLLLKQNDPRLGEKLLEASLFRSWEDRSFMANVFVWSQRKTDWFTFTAAEFTFRNLLFRYAGAFIKSSTGNPQAIAVLGAQLAQEMYGLTVYPDQVRLILDQAIILCALDYKDVIDQAIAGIRPKL